MRAFTCPDCSSLVPFDATHCLVSDSDLGYSRADRAMVVLHGGRTASGLVRCTNSDIAACNRLTIPDRPLCDCCRLTRTRPADGDTAALPMFARTEAAKRRLLYQLDDLGLPVGQDGDPEGGLAFDLQSSAHENVVIGHASGVVTIDLAEGDDGYREQLRIRLAEPYRTMLGHLRHETGHWYWEVLVDRPGNTDAFRALFADERVSYADALEQHYGGEPPAGWEERYVSTYATAHPWEDWVESFAHYLHIRDTEQTAAAYGLVVEGPDDAAAPPGGAAGGGADRATVDLRRDRRNLAAADVRAQCREPQHGRERPLSVRAGPDGAGEAAVRARPGAGAHPLRTPAGLRSSTASSTSATVSTEATAVQNPPTTSVG